MRVLSWILKLPLGILMIRPPNMVGKCKAKIVRVVDGDTYVVRRFGKEFKVRIIGVDTPESCVPSTYYKTNTKMGKYVSEEVKNKLRNNMTVYLEYDKQRQDKYGRTLAYVYFPTGKMVQMWLLKKGYAAPLPIKPNIKYEELFHKTAAKAIKHRKGIWK